LAGHRLNTKRLAFQGKKVLFVTNNSTKSRKAFKVKFDQLQLPVDQASPSLRLRSSLGLGYGEVLERGALKTLAPIDGCRLGCFTACVSAG
jgi:hypothetical protein